MKLRQKIADKGILLPAYILFSLFDTGVTLWGQPPEYWAGDYNAINELNPIAAVVLRINPWVFLAFGVLFMLLVSALFLWLRSPADKILLFFAVIMHAAAVSSWTYYRIFVGDFYLGYSLPKLVAAVILGYSFHRYESARQTK